ncbi:MAG: DoxX family protein [Candidatus Heimdallarchaeota archaeon]
MADPLYSVIFLIGRVVVGAFYLYNAWNHFKNVDMLQGYAGSKGVPSPRLAVQVTGLLLAIAGITFILGVFPEIGVLSLVAFFVPVNIMMHNFWTIEDAQMKAAERVQFMKNLALLGSALMFLAVPTPWSYSLLNLGP